MKASELRIGNLVEYPAWNNDGSKAYFSIRDIHFDEGKIGLTNGIIKLPSSHLDFIKPIPLTEEWLLKFGFKELAYGFLCKNKRIFLSESNDEFEYCALFFDCEEYITIEYVHQLQNLYFALTNEELNYEQHK